MENKEIKDLLKRYQEGTCTEAEKALLEAWYLEYNEDTIDINPRKIRAISEQVFKKLPGNSGRKFNTGLLLKAAAITVITVSLVLSIVFNRKQSIPPEAANDISPGGNKAVLTLANGKKIDLTKAAIGRLVAQHGISITKNAAGRVIYQPNDSGDQSEPTGTNNITTPAGGFWQIRLPDGTRVWLNNSSSLTYPGSFRKEKERRVELEGEAYFEVTEDKAHPFIVESGRQEVRVLGTHFNINAFKDEQGIRTTLLKGRVNVSARDSHLTKQLSPGAQSLLSDNNITITNANTEQVLAWKNGYFRFDNTPIEQVMREIARWYDIVVRYNGVVTGEKLSGRISRTTNINLVLKALEATKTVHFQVEGRRVTIMK